MLLTNEKRRLAVAKRIDSARKSQLGQFFTPERIAAFMAGMFSSSGSKVCRLLDAGAGIGSLTSAFLSRCADKGLSFDEISVTAYEVDESLTYELEESINSFSARLPLHLRLLSVDFIEDAVFKLEFAHHQRYTHVIMNPPYKKISSRSKHRQLLRKVGIETGNLYSAFVALSLALMKTGGELVVIIPRSFCNGPYFRSFREFILKRAAIRSIHLFRTRDRAFEDDAVLQENVILMLEKGGTQSNVNVSFSSDGSFNDLERCEIPFSRIVGPDDPELFIHIPMSTEPELLHTLEGLNSSLDDLGLSVSTGPIVDFRLKDQLRQMPCSGAIPLLYPSHFRGETMEWPLEGFKKPNSILDNANTRRFLFPAGYYCVVRRLSSKEEKKRIFAGIVDPQHLGQFRHFGFENHLNVFHINKQGMTEELARGLSLYLNAAFVDDYLRTFNGHTQVNAADLRKLRYPDKPTLLSLGKWAKQHRNAPQEAIDKQIKMALHERKKP